MTGVGLIGCGWVACEKHLPALARVDGLEVVALHDSAPGAIDRAARLAPAARRHAEVAALLEDPAVDVVAVLTPPTRHAEHSLAAFGAGKPVLCEKPLALAPEDASAICDAAANSGLLGATGLMSRALRVVQRARSAVEEGAIGEVVALQTVYADSVADAALGDRPWRRQRATGGGALQEKLVHHVDLWRFITGLEVEDARSERIGSSREEDEAVLLTGRMTGGVLASSIGLDRAATATVAVCGSSGASTWPTPAARGASTCSTGSAPGRCRASSRRSMPACCCARASRDSPPPGWWCCGWPRRRGDTRRRPNAAPALQGAAAVRLSSRPEAATCSRQPALATARPAHRQLGGFRAPPLAATITQALPWRRYWTGVVLVCPLRRPVCAGRASHAGD